MPGRPLWCYFSYKAGAYFFHFSQQGLMESVAIKLVVWASCSILGLLDYSREGAGKKGSSLQTDTTTPAGWPHHLVEELDAPTSHFRSALRSIACWLCRSACISFCCSAACRARLCRGRRAQPLCDERRLVLGMPLFYTLCGLI